LDERAFSFNWHESRVIKLVKLRNIIFKSEHQKKFLKRLLETTP
jgi:hypothetical protein